MSASTSTSTSTPVPITRALERSDSISQSEEVYTPKIVCPYCVDGDTSIFRSMNMREIEAFGILTCTNWAHYYQYCQENPDVLNYVEPDSNSK